MVAPSSIRAGLVFALLVACFAALGVRVGYLQTRAAKQNLARAERQQYQTEPLYARRGSIFDRNGLLMAGTVQSQSLFIDPKFMFEQFQTDGKSLAEMDVAVHRLCGLIGRDDYEVSQLLADRAASRFIRIADNLDTTTIKLIEQLDLPGVGFTPMNVRYYPMGSIAAHVLGGSGVDGRGVEGLELAYNPLLGGRDGYKRTLKDARRRPIWSAAEDYVPPRHGQHLLLTIDANIQMIAEQELAGACREFGAPRGEVVVMDPQTGEVLALADYPSYNPQDLNDSAIATRRNRAITDPYEPGSTIKPFIVGTALASGRVRVDEVLPTASPYHSSLRSKPVSDVHSYAKLNVWDVLVKSSNIGMTHLGERLGKDAINSALRRFGFGKLTGIEIAGENDGKVIPARRMSNSDVVSNVQGYAVMVTPLQLCRAMCTYANGGRLVYPRVVRGVIRGDGAVRQAPVPTLQRTSPTTALPNRGENAPNPEPVNATPPTPEAAPAHAASAPAPDAVAPSGGASAPDADAAPRQILLSDAAMQVRRILCDVVVRGTATKARSDIWNIFGKTGTAHTAVNGKYNESNYTSSFVGGAPFENPRLVIAMVIHDPDKSKAHYGGTVSAPAAKRVLERSLAYLQVPASPDLTLPPPAVAAGMYAYDPKVYRRGAKMTASAAE